LDIYGLPPFSHGCEARGGLFDLVYNTTRYYVLQDTNYYFYDIIPKKYEMRNFMIKSIQYHESADYINKELNGFIGFGVGFFG
jgi:hypothetical protein